MSLPRILAQIVFTGSRILGRAFMEAGRQAVRNVRAGQVEAGGAAAATGGKAGSPSDALTRAHRMTLDEARLILNLKGDVSLAANRHGIKDEVRKELVEHYERLFEINAPPAPKGKEGGGRGSFYVQSKKNGSC
ncbi:mitochondrial import inner membrane translocase subunit TIM16 [Malassezia caprae]|uniref:Mitochondrial import inner membrane translocase subunit TIM16 n=1 Tax=Malassezia caprae TaxID=1381934 RepID=A0AAF0EEE9_9BASI|nr:mitochondrial import inner membrane translocase subunit TIM16 [Malassezia caprae]